MGELKKFFVDPTRPPEIVYINEHRDAKLTDFARAPCILLLHGFASHCSTMDPLCQRLISNGFHVFGYNYRSYDSIKAISRCLCDLLDALIPGNLKKNRPFLDAIGHSMGGLILRDFVTRFQNLKYLRSVTMLGTPNNSTLDDRLIGYLIRHIQYVHAFFDPRVVLALSGDAAKELTKQDADERKDCFISQLNLLEERQGERIPYLTVAAGGGPRLRLCKRRVIQRLINAKIQAILNDPRNDGLVVEASVDLRKCVSDGDLLQRYEHYNDRQYGDFVNLDHSGLLESQVVALMVMNFIRNISTVGSDTGMVEKKLG